MIASLVSELATVFTFIRKELIKISTNLTNLISAYEKFWSETTFSQIIIQLSINRYGDSDILHCVSSPNIGYIDKLKKLLSKIPTQSYCQYLLKLMGEKNLTSVQIYTKGLMSKEQFSKIISGKNNRKAYIPKKQWLLQIAFAMELSLDETSYLLNKAGHAFIESDKSDFVFIFSFKNGIYDTGTINELLESNNFPILFKSA